MDGQPADRPCIVSSATAGSEQAKNSTGATSPVATTRCGRPSRLSPHLAAELGPPPASRSPTSTQTAVGSSCHTTALKADPSQIRTPLQTSHAPINQPAALHEEPASQHAPQHAGSIQAAGTNSGTVSAAAKAPAAAAASAETSNKDVAADIQSSDDERSAELDDCDDTDSLLDKQRMPWCTPMRLVVAVLVVLSATVAVAGLLVQVTIEDDQPQSSASWEAAQKAFPWLHFFSAFLPVSLTLHWLCWKLYKVAEWTAIREELYFLRPLRAKIASLLFWLVMLLWYQVCFTWVWCTDDRCSGDSYQEGLHVVWRLLICLTLFSSANTIKCGLARLLSYQFYRTAHFLKVKEAIERELYLIRLSQARSTLLPSMPDKSPAKPSTRVDSRLQQHGGVAGWLIERGSMIWQRGLGALYHHSERVSSEYDEVMPAVVADAQDHSVLAHMKDTDSGYPTAVVTLQSSSPAKQQKQLHSACTGHGLDHGPQLSHAEHEDTGLDGSIGHADSSATLDSCNRHTELSPKGSGTSSSQRDGTTPSGHIPCRREPSFEQFIASRVPSVLGRGQHASGTSRSGGKSCIRGSRCYTGSRASLANMVPGVDGLLLQPEVLEVTAGTKQAHGASAQPMTEQELRAMRKALGVNSYGAFVDRYYHLSSKEEAAHVRQVKRFAKGLFYNIKGCAERHHLLPADFTLFFNGDTDAAEEAFNYFDRNGDGSISCLELQDSAAAMLRERKNIAASIKDTDSVVDSLETGMGLLIHFIWMVFYLLVWGVNVVQGFTTFSTTVLALTFVFGDSVKSVFESALFLFLEHPYDVGDSLVLTGDVIAKVKKIDLMYTVLLGSSGEMVWHPNYLMRSAVLVNLSRSRNKWEGFSWLVDLNTPDEVLESIEAAMKAHMLEHSAHFRGDPAVAWRGLEEPCKLRLYVGWSYSFTGEDLRRLRIARVGMLKVIRHELQRLGVTYTLPMTPAASPYLTKTE